MTETWVTVLAALVAGGIGAVLTTLMRGRQERRADLREKMLDRGSEFSGQLQAAFGPIIEAIDARSSEPDVVPSYGPEGEEQYEEPIDTWSEDTVQAHHSAREVFLRVESARTPLLLLLPADSVAVRAADEAVSMLSSAIGALNEPDDETVWSRQYVLQAQLSWLAFNQAMRREISRAGRRVAPWTRRREFARHKAWLHQETERRTVRDAEAVPRVVG